MNFFKKLLIVSLIVTVLVAVVAVVLSESFDSLKDPYNDDWYIDSVKNTAIDYISSSELEEQALWATNYHFTEYDNDIVMANRGKEEKVYPFQAIDVTLESRTQKYVVYMIVDEDGQLQIDHYEKSEHFNPFVN